LLLRLRITGIVALPHYFIGILQPMTCPSKAHKTKKDGKLKVLAADEAPVLAAAAKLRAEARPAKRPSFVQEPSAVSCNVKTTVSATTNKPGAGSQQSAIFRAAQAQNTTGPQAGVLPYRQPHSVLEPALSLGAHLDEAQKLIYNLGAVMQAYRPKRTYELLLRKAERALEASTRATIREQLQVRVDRMKALATEANTTLLWMSRFTLKKHVPKLNTLKAKQALLARLRAELPAEAEAYKVKEKAAAEAGIT
jgi:hypothetical protein